MFSQTMNVQVVRSLQRKLADTTVKEQKFTKGPSEH